MTNAETSPKPLPLRDTPQIYGRVTRALHWSIAVLILWQFFGMGMRLIFGRTDFVSSLVGSHQPVGTVLLVLILLRVIWAISNRNNRPAHGAGLLGLAAKLGHWALYLALLLVPVTAVLRAFGNTRPFAPFGFEIFPAQPEAIGWMVTLGDAVHGELAWVMGVLILGHVAMVALHEGLWRDGTLAKMVSRKG